MDVATNRTRKEEGKLHGHAPGSRLAAMGQLSSLDGAVLTMFALSFGPLTRTDLVAALKQAGFAMPDGSAITAVKLGPSVRVFRQKGWIVERGGNTPECPADVRSDAIEVARARGDLRRLGDGLRKAVPAELTLDSWEYRWRRQRFKSFSHACRDAFLALEKADHGALDRLSQLCQQDERVQSLVNVLFEVCGDPFRPEYIELAGPYRNDLLYGILRSAVYDLNLQSPVFAYTRSKVLTERDSFDRSTLEICINHIAERDILAGDFAGARALLSTYADLDTHIMRGTLELLCGDLPAARLAYQRAVQHAGKTKRDQMAYLGSFPGLLHVLLLVQSESLPTSGQDRHQARTWLGWVLKGGSHARYYSAYFYLDALLSFYEGCTTPGGPAWRPSHRQGPSLVCLATCLMQMMYGLYASDTQALKARNGAAMADMENLLDQWDQRGARWPVMQLSRLMDRFGVALPQYAARAESFFVQSPARDLSELWAVKEMWESQIGALEQLVQESESAAGEVAQNTRRLGWRLSDAGEGMILVTPVEQKRSKKGSWTGGREVALHRLMSPEISGLDYLTDQDKATLAGATGRRSGGYYSYNYAVDLNPGPVLQHLVGHTNVFWEGAPDIPVEIVRGTPEVRIVPKGQKLNITMDPYPDPYYCDGVWAIERESASRLRIVKFDAVHRKMAEILGPTGVTIPRDRSEEALKRLQGLSRHVAIQSNVALAGEEAEAVEPDCRPRLRLQRFAEGLQVQMVVVPMGGESQRAFTPGAGNSHLLESVAGRTVQAHRNLKEETARAAEAVAAVAMLEAGADCDYTWTFGDPLEALELLEQLQGISPELLTVEWPKGDPITVRPISAKQFQFSIRSAQNWFEVEATVQVDRDVMIKMQTLLDQIESANGRFIAIGKNQYIALTRQLRKQLQGLSMSGQPVRKGGALRIHPLAAITLEQWKDEVGRFKADAAFHDWVERFRAIESYQAAIPSTLQATLRPYQQDGFFWLARLAEWGAGGCLADDMGLGKTIEALALILHRAARGPTLVVAPTSVCANWVNETQRFAPTLHPIRFGIDDRGRREQVLENVGPFDLVICSYTLLQQEADAIKDVHFATIVLDEAQAIKNAATKRSSAAMGLVGDFRMISTGTPIENRLAELWNLFRFINSGLLGSEDRFRDRFVRPIEIDRDSSARATLKALVQPFILRRTKSQVLEDLPARTEVMRLVELTEDERALHESLRRRALERLEGVRDMDKGQAHIQVLAELMKLRRCCCNPRLVVPDCGLPGSKLEAFAELVDELLDNQHKALVFSQFVDHLSLLREHLDTKKIRYQYLDGSTPARTRQKRIDAFQNGQGDLFLISLKAGGLGLNLTAADYVIHMDPWWNPAVEDQASDRAHRIGQTRPVTVYRLVAAETIEEKIVQLHHAKRDLADSLLEGTDAAHALTADDLINLLRNR